MGILGLPNIGKSSFFNVLTKQSVPAENFPFCTIDPSTAKVAVPDKRFNFLCETFKPKSEVSAALTVVDIAGLVRGASEGAGLGNEFLSHVKAVDGLFHLCRGFEVFLVFEMYKKLTSGAHAGRGGDPRRARAHRPAARFGHYSQ